MKFKLYYIKEDKKFIGITMPGFLGSSANTVKGLIRNIRRQWRWEMQLYSKEKYLLQDLNDERFDKYSKSELFNSPLSIEMDT